jgi:H+/Cl- antiporter ClcA
VTAAQSKTPVRDVRHLGDYSTTPRMLVITALAAPVGAVSACVAWALLRLIGLITNAIFYERLDAKLVLPSGGHSPWYVILLAPAVGGLIVGLIARYGSEKIRGHGIPEAIESILLGGSKVEPRVSILKPIASAVTIGTGGPFGAEGPIIMTGGAFGSLFAQFLRLTADERKTLLVAGSAAGMAATFNAPFAALLLAVELAHRTERAGLIERVRDVDDQRVVRLRLSPDGERVIAALSSAHLEELGRLATLFESLIGTLSTR